MNLDNVEIGLRPSIGFGAVLTLMLAIVFIAYNRLQYTSNGMKEMSGQQQRGAIAQD